GEGGAGAAQDLPGEPAVEHPAAGPADAGGAGEAGGAVRAQRLHPGGDLGTRLLRPVGRRAGQGAGPADRAGAGVRGRTGPQGRRLDQRPDPPLPAEEGGPVMSPTLQPGAAARPTSTVRSDAAVIHPAPGVDSPRPTRRWFSLEGNPLPFGQSWVESEQAYNFSLFSENASGVTLLLHAEPDTA